MTHCKNSGIASSLATLFFPPLCLACDNIIREEEGSRPFCPSCYSKITPCMDPLCSVCGMPLAGSGDEYRICGKCLLRPPFFSRARTLGKYDGPLLEAIHLFKYQKNVTAGERLGRMMARWSLDCLDLSAYERIIPVPLHPSKLRNRGFNQSLVLARQIARTGSIPLDVTTLVKDSDGIAQVGLGEEERKKNVRNRFSVCNRKGLSGKRFLLVDDVYTTGSTVDECARVLLMNGAKEVGVAALARA